MSETLWWHSTEPPTRLPVRAEVRALAEANMAQLRAVAARGGNPHQRGLDQTDELRTYATRLETTLGTATAQQFIDMYADELHAINAMDEAKENTKQVAAVRSNAMAATIGSVVLFLAIYFFIRVFT